MSKQHTADGFSLERGWITEEKRSTVDGLLEKKMQMFPL
jgi:hypothetical protein